MECPNCHAENSCGTLFCVECGAFLNPENPDLSFDEEEISSVDMLALQQQSQQSQQSATIADMDALLKEIGLDINSDNEYNHLPFTPSDMKKKDLKRKSVEEKKNNTQQMKNKDNDIQDSSEGEDDEDDFEHTKHSLKIIMAGLALTAVIAGVFFGIMNFSTAQNEKKELNNYVLMLSSANELVDLGDYSAAEEAYKNVINYNPSLSAAYYGLSKVYTLMGDDKNAKFILEQGYLNTGDPLLL